MINAAERSYGTPSTATRNNYQGERHDQFQFLRRTLQVLRLSDQTIEYPGGRAMLSATNFCA